MGDVLCTTVAKCQKLQNKVNEWLAVLTTQYYVHLEEEKKRSHWHDVTLEWWQTASQWIRCVNDNNINGITLHRNRQSTQHWTVNTSVKPLTYHCQHLIFACEQYILDKSRRRTVRSPESVAQSTHWMCIQFAGIALYHRPASFPMTYAPRLPYLHFFHFTICIRRQAVNYFTHSTFYVTAQLIH